MGFLGQAAPIGPEFRWEFCHVYDELVQPMRLGAALVEATGDDRWRDPAVELIRGGKSNLTFWVRSDAGELVLRRPPLGNLLPSAHDMVREAWIQTALARSDVPVPRIVLVDDGDLIGASCYVMERVTATSCATSCRPHSPRRPRSAASLRSPSSTRSCACTPWTSTPWA